MKNIEKLKIINEFFPDTFKDILYSLEKLEKLLELVYDKSQNKTINNIENKKFIKSEKYLILAKEINQDIENLDKVLNEFEIFENKE